MYLLVFGHSKQLSQNKFFDQSTPSMRKVDDGENYISSHRTPCINSITCQHYTWAPPSGDKLLPSNDQADHHVAEGAGDAHGQVAQGQGPEIHLGQPGEYIVEIDIFLRSLYN